MRIVAIKTLRDFWIRHPESEQPLLSWIDETRRANWTQPAKIKARFGNANVLKSRRVVFNIKGNDFRLVVAVAYRVGVVYVKFIGTHREYDRIDADTIEME